MSEPSILRLFLTTFISYCMIMFTIVSTVLPFNYRATVVKVIGYSGHGSGMVIKSDSKKSLVLTNKHVCNGVIYTLDEIEDLKVIMKKGTICYIDYNHPDCLAAIKEYNEFVSSISGIGREVDIKFNNYNNLTLKGTIKKISSKYDLCLVEVNQGDLPTIQIARNSPVAGDHVFTIGNPLNMENHQTDGWVGDYITYQGNNYQHISSEIYPGNSGGASVNDRGELVGVNTLGSEVPTGSYMIPLEDIKDFLEE